ncbi:MAG: hypothetical protein GY950_03265 [bacterium]|nr:hypothetical protein [bacterium]
MSNKLVYDEKLAEITAITDEDVRIPGSIPVDVYVQEAENLYIWCQEDQAQLTAKGLDWVLVEDMAARSGALGRAQALWTRERNTREEAERLWRERSPLAYKLRNDLLRDFRFAYRKDDDLIKKVRAITDGASNADMIQDLNDLAALGEKHPDLLTATNFDLALLDQADQMADEMSALYAGAIAERAEYSEAKKIRDKAYTYLKEAVDEIYAFGRYLFRENDARRIGYRSSYLQQARSKQKPAAEPVVSDAAAEQTESNG